MYPHTYVLLKATATKTTSTRVVSNICLIQHSVLTVLVFFFNRGIN